MAGRFEGLSNLEWKLFEDLLPQPAEKRGRGMPHVPFRKVLNTQHLRADYAPVDGATYHKANNGHQRVLAIGG